MKNRFPSCDLYGTESDGVQTKGVQRSRELNALLHKCVIESRSDFEIALWESIPFLLSKNLTKRVYLFSAWNRTFQKKQLTL